MFYFAYFDPLSPPNLKNIYIYYIIAYLLIFFITFIFLLHYTYKKDRQYACLKENQMTLSEISSENSWYLSSSFIMA